LTQARPPLKENGQYNLFFVAENNTIKSAKKPAYVVLLADDITKNVEGNLIFSLN